MSMTARIDQLSHRVAGEDDLPALYRLIERSIGSLQSEFLTHAQVAASHHVIVASGPDHRPNNTYLTVSAARRLATDLLDAAAQVDHTAE